MAKTKPKLKQQNNKEKNVSGGVKKNKPKQAKLAFPSVKSHIENNNETLKTQQGKEQISIGSDSNSDDAGYMENSDINDSSDFESSSAVSSQSESASTSSSSSSSSSYFDSESEEESESDEGEDDDEDDEENNEEQEGDNHSKNNLSQESPPFDSTFLNKNDSNNNNDINNNNNNNNNNLEDINNNNIEYTSSENNNYSDYSDQNVTQHSSADNGPSRVRDYSKSSKFSKKHKNSFSNSKNDDNHVHSNKNLKNNNDNINNSDTIISGIHAASHNYVSPSPDADHISLVDMEETEEEEDDVDEKEKEKLEKMFPSEKDEASPYLSFSDSDFSVDNNFAPDNSFGFTQNPIGRGNGKPRELFVPRTTEDVEEWLDSIGLAQYAKQFRKHHIVGVDLFELSDQELKHELEIKSLGHRKRLIRAAKQLKNNILNMFDVN